MSKSVRIALDVMGGDHGPAAVIPGAAMVLERRPDISFLLYGDESQMRPLLARYPKLVAASTVIHTPVSVKMSDKPSQALRQGRRTSSMWLAIDAVKRGEAAAAVSAGNTGALMAMATFCLRTMTRIERPAIACVWPNIRGRSIVLDVGATVGADAQHLVEMAIMGAEMARILFGLERPTVGIINVGVEEIKGIDEVKAANRILRAMDSPHFAYSGFIEGNDIAKGTVDVAVTDGFSGNIALKSAEGTIRQFAHTLREELSSSLMARLGYLMAHGALGRVKDRMDPRKSNGGVLLGLNGFVIKSHGGTDAAGFAFAVEIGHDLVHQDLLARIRDLLAILDAGPTPAIGALASGVRS